VENIWIPQREQENGTIKNFIICNVQQTDSIELSSTTACDFINQFGRKYSYPRTTLKGTTYQLANEFSTVNQDQLVFA